MATRDYDQNLLESYFNKRKINAKSYTCTKNPQYLSVKKIFVTQMTYAKVNSLVQEPCTKCFVVHILKFEILQTTLINKTKSIKMLDFLDSEKLKTNSLMFFVSFFSCDLQSFQILICEPHSIWRKVLVLN